MTVETTGQIITRLLHDRGGQLLIVGEGTRKAIQPAPHPQVTFWESLEGDVPSNTRAILLTRYAPHSTSVEIRKAAQRLRVPIWMPQTNREIREILDVLRRRSLTTQPIEEPVAVPEPPAVPEPQKEPEPMEPVPNKLIPVQTVASRLRTSNAVVHNLIHHGVLRDYNPKNPANKRHYAMLDAEEVRLLVKLGLKKYGRVTENTAQKIMDDLTKPTDNGSAPPEPRRAAKPQPQSPKPIVLASPGGGLLGVVQSLQTARDALDTAIHALRQLLGN